MSALCACGKMESERNTMEADTESTEPGIWYQNGGESGQTYQAGQEVAKRAEYETKEIMPVVIMSYELGATLKWQFLISWIF